MSAGAWSAEEPSRRASWEAHPGSEGPSGTSPVSLPPRPSRPADAALPRLGPDEQARRWARALLEAVEAEVWSPGHAVDIGATHLSGEPVPYAEAVARPFHPFAVGDEWGPLWGTTWFRVRGVVPEAWRGQEVVLRYETVSREHGGRMGEGLVWRDGAPLQGVSRNHRFVVLTTSAEGGERVELYVEAAANGPTPDRPLGRAWPLLLPGTGPDPRYRLARCDLAALRPEVEALAYELRTVLALAEAVEDGPRMVELEAALVMACEALDADDVVGTAGAARAALAGALARPTAPRTHRVTAVGHAHIDTAWLWPVRETVRKCARTFATAVTLMERYPEYHFVCSAAQHLAWIEERYPALFARIVERVRTGQFEPVGSMWVEADCNIPSGESLVRQILHGKRWFSEHLGVECREAWLPDAFGYSASLPQILAAAGIDWFVSQKISWNDTNLFPHHTFWWEGIDGTRVRAHFPPADTYSGDMTVRELRAGAANAVRRGGGTARSLYPFGMGDGGGGPTREMIEAARRAADVDGLPVVAMEPVAAFFAAAEADPTVLPVWVGELYLERHRGVQTTHADVKRRNRRNERALQAAELWSTVQPGAAEHDRRPDLDRAWKLLLTNQFHDILPGSSIHWVYERVAAEYEQVEATAGGITAEALAALAGEIDTVAMDQPVILFNSTPCLRRELVEVDGRTFFADVPPLGYAAVDLSTVAGAAGGVEAGDGWVANEALVVRWDADGRLVSVWDREHEREVLAPGRAGNVLELHDDRPSDADAWDVERRSLDAFVELGSPVEITVDAGPARAAVRFRRRVGESEIDQTMVLTAGSRRVDFVTEVDWQERHKLLKVAFPVDVHTSRATYEIQFGHLERPTHENTSWDRARFEVPAQRWADLSEAGYGVALLNDCKYGYDVHGNVLRLSLLRSPTAPDPLPDRGHHLFTYALLPHGGEPGEGGVVAEAYALNTALEVVPTTTHGGRLPSSLSFLSTEDPGIMIDTVKRPEEGPGVVVRLYEAFGGHRSTRVRCVLPFSRAVRTDLLEREREELPVAGEHVLLSLRPFELVTLKLLPPEGGSDETVVTALHDHARDAEGRVEHGEAGGVAGLGQPEPVAEAEVAGRVGGGHAQGLVDGDAHVVDEGAHPVDEGGGGPGQHTLGGEAAAVVDRHLEVAQTEVPPGASDGGHGVAHQHGVTRPAQGEDEGQGDGVDVVAVGDHRAPGRGGGQVGPGHPGLAGGQGAHGVEQVGGAVDPGGDGTLRLVESGVGVAGGDPGTPGDQVGDQAHGCHLGGEGHHGDAAAGPAQGESHVLPRAVLDPPPVVHAGSGRGDHRPLEVDAEDAVHPVLDAAADRLGRGRHPSGRAGEEGQEEVGGAQTAVGVPDAPRALRGEVGGEEHVATAVDLQVHEPGAQRLPTEVDHLGVGRDGVLVDDRRHEAPLDEEHRVVQHAPPGVDHAVAESEHGGAQMSGGRGIVGADGSDGAVRRAGHRHLLAAVEALSSLEPALPLIGRWGHHLASVLRGGGRLLAAGNGGSAAQAEHLAAELVGRYRRERPALSALALSSEGATVTALGNDYGMEALFSRQVEAHGRPGDVLVAVSTSGRSPDVLAAVATARERGITTWALTGRAPNPLAEAADEALCVDAEETATVQEAHEVVAHLLCEALDASLEEAVRPRS